MTTCMSFDNFESLPEELFFNGLLDLGKTVDNLKDGAVGKG